MNNSTVLKKNPLNTVRYKNHYLDAVRNVFILKYPEITKVSDIPYIKKIVVHITSKEAIKDKKELISMQLLVESITGQKPQILVSKKSIATFGVRKGALSGVKVTLRDKMMYGFLDKIVTLILTKKNNFTAFNRLSVNKNSATFGIENSFYFPEIEINSDKFKKFYGLEFTVVTSTNNKDMTSTLLSAMNIPLK